MESDCKCQPANRHDASRNDLNDFKAELACELQLIVVGDGCLYCNRVYGAWQMHALCTVTIGC